MSKILLAVISATFLMFPGSQAQACFSETHCCTLNKIDDIWTKINRTMGDTRPLPLSDKCQASSEGPSRERSTSPWTYEEDTDSSRYPQRLLQAKCSCHRCVSLRTCVVQGDKRIYTNQALNGNSINVTHDTLVFYRKVCPENPKLYYLESAMYPVNVSCICVAAEEANCPKQVEDSATS